MAADVTAPAGSGRRPRSFGRLLAWEQATWWGTPRWWAHAAGWSLLLGGTTVLMLAGVPQAATALGLPAMSALSLDQRRSLAALAFAAVLVPQSVAVLVIAGRQIAGERERGVAEWILSKPVSRAAYVLAKAASDAIGIAFSMVLIPFAVAYGVALSLGVDLAPAGFGLALLLGFGMLVLWHAFGLFVGAVAPSLKVALGVSLAALFVSSGLHPLVTSLQQPASLAGAVLLTPWELARGIEPVVLWSWRLSPHTALSLLATAGWTILLYGAAVGAVRRQDV